MKLRIGAALALFLLVSNGSRAVEPKTSAAEAALRAADQAWLKVFQARDLDESVAFCAESGSVLAPNAPRASGRDAIRQLFAGYFALPQLAIEWSPSSVRVARSGDLGYTTGAYRMSFQDPAGKTVEDRGKYVTVWEKGSDGKWRVLIDAFNTELPAPGASR